VRKKEIEWFSHVFYGSAGAKFRIQSDEPAGTVSGPQQDFGFIDG
jgi:hypothetical protein